MDEIQLAKRRTDALKVNQQDALQFRGQGKLPLKIDTGPPALAASSIVRTSPTKGNMKLPPSTATERIRNLSTSSPRSPTRLRTGKRKSSTPSPRTPLSAVSLGSANPAELISRKPRSLSFYLDLDGSDVAQRRQRARAYSMVADSLAHKMRSPELVSPGPPKSALAAVASLKGSQNIRSAFDAVPSRPPISPLNTHFPSLDHPTAKSPVSTFASNTAARFSPPSPTTIPDQFKESTRSKDSEHYTRMNARLLNASLHRSRYLQERRMKLKCKSDIIKNRVLLQKYKDRMQQLRFQTRHNFDMVAADLKRRLILQRNTERWRAHVRKAQTIAKLQRLQKCLYLRRTYSDTFSEMTPSILRGGGIMFDDENYSLIYTDRRALDVDLEHTSGDRCQTRSAYPHGSGGSPKQRLYLPNIEVPSPNPTIKLGHDRTLSSPSTGHTSPLPTTVQIMRSGVGRPDETLSPTHAAEGTSFISAWGGTNVVVSSSNNQDVAVRSSASRKLPSLTIPSSVKSPPIVTGQVTALPSPLSPLRRSISVPSDLHSPGIPLLPIVSPSLDYPGAISEVRDVPPISRYTLRELDLEEMLNSVQLRHDLVFDPALTFRRNFDGDVGAMKQAKNDTYWAKLEAEIEGKEYQVPESVANLPPQLAEQLPAFTMDPSSQRGHLSRIPGLIYEVREIMLELLPYSDAFHYEINEKMDIQLIHQEIQNGVFNIIGLVEWISEVLRANCAPFRDRLAHALVDDVKDGRFGKAFRGLFEMLELMKLDIANHQLGSEYRPHIIGNAAEYEWKSFKMQMDSETTTLDGTSAWLKEGMTRSPGKKFDQVFSEAVVHLVSNPVDTSSSFSSGEDSAESPGVMAFPETFRLDTSRLQAFHHDFQDVVIMATVLMLFRQAAGPKCNTIHAQELKKVVWVLLNDTDTTMAHVTSEIAHRAGKIQGRVFGDKEVAILTGMAERTLSRDSMVLKVLGRKVGTVLTCLLSRDLTDKEDGVKKVLVTVTPIVGLKSVALPVDRNQLRLFGLLELEEEILNLGARIKQLADYNRSVYILAYQAIWSSTHVGEKIAGLEEEGADVGAADDVDEIKSDSDDSD